MLSEYHLAFIEEMGPKLDSMAEPDHKFINLFRLTGNQEKTEFFYKLYNVTVGWTPHTDCEIAMIDRAYLVWKAIKDSLIAPFHFSCGSTHYEGTSCMWSIAVMINFQNIDDYHTALTMIKLNGLDRIRMHF